jgi:hypothetical protein
MAKKTITRQAYAALIAKLKSDNERLRQSIATMRRDREEERSDWRKSIEAAERRRATIVEERAQIDETLVDLHGMMTMAVQRVKGVK